ncbi:hypothetical protein C8J57DRAFT_1289177 [Mycena rebaudengoi]|nr:hypothetical protein C8J57DRAFT_1289177 [Mycena rebaudengoi]
MRRPPVLSSAAVGACRIVKRSALSMLTQVSDSFEKSDGVALGKRVLSRSRCVSRTATVVKFGWQFIVASSCSSSIAGCTRIYDRDSKCGMMVSSWRMGSEFRASILSVLINLAKPGSDIDFCSRRRSPFGRLHFKYENNRGRQSCRNWWLTRESERILRDGLGDQ